MVKSFISNLEKIAQFKKIMFSVSNETIWFVDFFGIKMEIIKIERENLFFLNNLLKKVSQIKSYLSDLNDFKADNNEIVFFNEQSKKINETLDKCIELHKKYEPDLIEIKKFFDFIFEKKINMENINDVENNLKNNFNNNENQINSNNNFFSDLKFKKPDSNFFESTESNAKMSQDLLEKIRKLKDI